MSIETVLKIEGMTCSGCIGSVTRVLQALPGVEKVDVSLEQRSAKVRYDDARVNREDFRRAIDAAGFSLR